MLRAQDDGVAFRYRFPESTGGRKTVVGEQTGFTVPDGATAWMLPRQPVGKYAPAYEDLFQQVGSGTASALPDGWDLPALFKTRDGLWALVTESALDATYCGSHLAQHATGGTYRIAFPDPGEGRGVGDANPASTLPWTMPWRVIVVGDAAGRILESDLVTDVAPPSKIGPAAWVRPGRAAWSWWSMSDSPKHADELNAFTDLAAEMGWEYTLVDANWNFMERGTIDERHRAREAKRRRAAVLVQLRRPAQRRHRGAARPHVHARAARSRSSRSCARGASRASRSTSGRATSRIASRSTAICSRTPPASS